MFYFLGMEGSRYKVLDNSDGTVEILPKKYIDKAKSLGIYIKGIDDLTVKLPKVVFKDKYDYGDRLIAIIVADGTYFESDCNHQECLAQLLQSRGTSLEELYSLSLDDEHYDDNIEKVCEITYGMFNDHELFGFDVYDDEVLVAHDEDTFIACYGWMKDYGKKHNLDMMYCWHDGNIYRVELQEQ